MAFSMSEPVIAETVWDVDDSNLWIKRAALVVLGVLVLWACAKAKIPLGFSPVPINLGTFGMLALGAAYGPRLGLFTILAYMLVGALGFDVFANSSAENNGLSYMTGPTGGYLLGFVIATVALGMFARLKWDRSVLLTTLAMVIGNVIIYVLGVAWLYLLIDGGLFNPEKFATAWQQALQWGLWPFLTGDAVKIAAASLLLPGLWRLVGDARV